MLIVKKVQDTYFKIIFGTNHNHNEVKKEVKEIKEKNNERFWSVNNLLHFKRKSFSNCTAKVSSDCKS